MVKFEQEDDRNKVINRGPWMIFDNYLSVRTWSADFNVGTATIDKTLVWVRIPSLNLVYYDESLLWTLASGIGKLIKVDLHTLRVACGKFARICVEIDFSVAAMATFSRIARSRNPRRWWRKCLLVFQNSKRTLSKNQSQLILRSQISRG